MRYHGMTVGDLIEKLREFPEYAPVLIYAPADEFDMFSQHNVTKVERRYEDVIVS